MKEPLQKPAIIRAGFGIIICGMFIAASAGLLYLPIPESNQSAVNILIGSLSTLIGMVFTFYFGSSEGSSRKSDTIDKILKDSQTTINDIVPPFDDKQDLEEVESMYRVHQPETEEDSPLPPGFDKRSQELARKSTSTRPKSSIKIPEK